MGTARYDKYDGKVGGFRARLNAAWGSALVGVPTGVTLNGSGRVVAAAAADISLAVLVIDRPLPAGEPVDCMTSGEIVDCEGLTAGTVYYTAADGTLTDTAPAAAANKVRVGHTVEAGRLVVRVQKVQG